VERPIAGAAGEHSLLPPRELGRRRLHSAASSIAELTAPCTHETTCRRRFDRSGRRRRRCRERATIGAGIEFAAQKSTIEASPCFSPFRSFSFSLRGWNCSASRMEWRRRERGNSARWAGRWARLDTWNLPFFPLLHTSASYSTVFFFFAGKDRFHIT
jgi:hypothetical protein